MSRSGTPGSGWRRRRSTFSSPGPRRRRWRRRGRRSRRSEAELRRAESQVRQAQAELGVARAALGSTVVESTLDGKVTRKLVEPGEAVDISMPLMILGDLQKIIVKAEVDETDVGKLAAGAARRGHGGCLSRDESFRVAVYEMGQSVGKRKVEARRIRSRSRT